LPIVDVPSNPPADLAFQISLHRTPHLIRNANTGVDSWNAIKKWTKGYLLEHAIFSSSSLHSDKSSSKDSSNQLQERMLSLALPNVKNGTDPVFLLANFEKPLREMPLTKSSDRHASMSNYQTISEMSFASFLQSEPCRDCWESIFEDGQVYSERREYLYYSGRLSWMSPQLQRDIEPFDFFMLDPNLSAPMIWMGHEGVIANTHYDRSHNFFVQVVGTKRWLLYPPSSWTMLYLFPSLHPHYHQTQVDYDDPDLQAYPFFSYLRPAFEVILHPGDILYIPPYWLHRVESLSFSVSVSILSPSEEERIYQEALWVSVPLSREWPVEDQLWAIHSYVEMLVEATYPPPVFSAAQLVQLMLLDNHWMNFPLHPDVFDDCDVSLLAFLSGLQQKTSKPQKVQENEEVKESFII
jgi:hypothetical protein